MVESLGIDEVKMLFWGGPIAIILDRKNVLQLRKVEPMREFFVNDMGVFMVDSQTQYRHGKQLLSFYNSHDTGIARDLAKKIYELYIKKKFLSLKRLLITTYPEFLENKEFTNIHELLQVLVDKQAHHAIDIDTEKYLPYYRAYNPISIKRLNEVCNDAKKSVDNMNPLLKNAMPLGIMVIGGLIGVALIQNLPKWIRELSSSFGG